MVKTKLYFKAKPFSYIILLIQPHKHNKGQLANVMFERKGVKI